MAAVPDGIVVFILHTSRPGAYAHNVSHDRRVEFDESFGGTRSLKTTVTVKCTKGIPDQASVLDVCILLKLPGYTHS